MRHFFAEHKKFNDKNINQNPKKENIMMPVNLEEDIQCEEEFLQNIQK